MAESNDEPPTFERALRRSLSPARVVALSCLSASPDSHATSRGDVLAEEVIRELTDDQVDQLVLHAMSSRPSEPLATVATGLHKARRNAIVAATLRQDHVAREA